MKLPKVFAGVKRFGVGRNAEENAGILPSKCDWSCRKIGCTGWGARSTDPVCEATKAACRACMNFCSNLPEGSHAREVCESKC